MCIVLSCNGVSQNEVGKLRCLCHLFQYRVGRTGETFKKEHASTKIISNWMTPTNWNENNSGNWLLYYDNWEEAKVSLRTLPHPASHTLEKSGVHIKFQRTRFSTWTSHWMSVSRTSFLYFIFSICKISI